MARQLAILCSGQGGQSAAMVDLLHTDAVAMSAWQHLFGEKWSAICGDSATSGYLPASGYPADSLDSANAAQAAASRDAGIAANPAAMFLNRHAQPLVAAFGLAAWQVLAPGLPRPALVAGYSVGEMTACGVAGALLPDQVMALTQQRAALMDAAASLAGPQGLLAVSGTPWAALSDLIAAHRVFLAIDNGEQSCVLGGLHAHLEALARVLAAQGVRTQALAVSVAAHTPLMQTAAPAFLAALQQAAWQRPRSPLLAGIDARRVLRADSACETLAQALCAPIRWAACMDALAEAQTGVALELGPGAALARMMQARHPHIACRSLADFRSLSAARDWLQRQLDG